MPTTLIAWELGSGLGHVAPLRPVCEGLVRRGRRVVFATRNVELCRQALAGTGAEVVMAPDLPMAEIPIPRAATFADVLHDCGYADPDRLGGALAGWLRLIEGVAPDTVVADHSPTALLASRVRGLPAAVIGSGFLCPPPVSPLPGFRCEQPAPPSSRDAEEAVLDAMNRVLLDRGAMSLGSVASLYSEASRRLFLVPSVLDPYGALRHASGDDPFYCPVFDAFRGVEVDWPSTGAVMLEVRKLFVYLHDHPHVLPVLQGLAYKGVSTVCCAPKLQAETIGRFAGSSVRVSNTPVDLEPLLQSCDAALINGGLGTVCECLRAGVPMLVLPMQIEQRLTGDRLVELGVGLIASREDLNATGAALERLLEGGDLGQNAQEYARHFAGYDSARAMASLVDRIESMASAAL
ncbi:MAG: glycosyltransferase [Lacipirellulaceae bacterium]